MTDECIIPTENGIQKGKSLHRVTLKEKFLISELEKTRLFPWNDVAENLKWKDWDRLFSLTQHHPTKTRRQQEVCARLTEIDVATTLVPKENVWPFEVMKTRAREIQFQDGEQESVAIVDREDPSVSKNHQRPRSKNG